MFIGMNFDALAQSTQHDEIMRLGEQFVLAELNAGPDHHVTAKAMPIDNRIDIPACPQSYDVTAAPNALLQSNVTVKVSCAANNWFIYFVVKVKETQLVIVANNALSPGSLITEQDIETEEMDKSLLRYSTFASADEVIGARAKRRLIAGQPISPNQLCFVCKGDAITIIAKGGGIQVKAAGIAQQDGNVGEQILVRNERTKKVVNAQVDSTSEVIVRL